MEKALLKSFCIGLILISSALVTQAGDTIFGQVFYHNQYPMPNVTAKLKNVSTNVVVATAVSNGNGNYMFPNVAPGNYSISFSTTSNAGGVNLSDAFMIFMYCMGYIQMNNIQLLASDVTGNGTVTLADYTYMMVNYLTQGNMFPIGPWVFETKYVTAGTGSRTGTGVSSSGSSSGDVNGNFVPTKYGTQASTFATFENISSESTSNIPLPVKLSYNSRIGGMHLAFRLPEGLEVTDITSPLEGIKYDISGDILRVTWLDNRSTEMDGSLDGIDVPTDQPIFNVTAQLEGLAFKGHVYSFELLGESHFISTSGEIIYGMQILTPSLTFTNSATVTLTTYPNPFFEYSTISINTPDAGNLMISLYDNNGRLVRVIENQYVEPGIHQVVINGSDLTSGMYIYKVRLDGQTEFSQTGTIIKSR